MDLRAFFAVNTPLWEFIRKIAGIKRFDYEDLCIGVLQKVAALPVRSAKMLDETEQAFRDALNRLGGYDWRSI